MIHVDIYTDGACSGNPGPGGWGAILICRGVEKEISGGEKLTTNNRMELSAAICALKCLKKPCDVTLYSDSAYLVNGFNAGWIVSWKRNGWKNSSKQTVSNIDLWQELDALTQIHRITWVKVKGHADNAYNNRCDALAVAATKKAGE
ncbi:MAG: ribonuclease HI [Clostridiales bacterium]|nr:ribonuclease HI [Clostridiales bacterium]